jgi:hypothetical protein
LHVGDADICRYDELWVGASSATKTSDERERTDRADA